MQIVLFKDDWKNFPTAIVDYNTSNKSFLKLVKLYKKMGIDNCEFPLALMQPELSGVDPYDPLLDGPTKMKIALECRFNPWYYWREVCRIPPNAGSVPIPFKANRGNIALFWSFFNHVDFGLLQPRQTGKSVSTDTLMTGLMNIWANNTTINLITKDNKLRASNIERLKQMRDLLPDYIYWANPNDADNTELMTNVALNNRYKTAVGRNDRVGADKLGRGLTVPIMHFDEFAYINLVEISTPVALSSGSAAREEAANADQPYGNIFTTTAGSLNDRDGKYAHSFMTGGAPWTEKFFDLKNQQELAKVVRKQSTGLKALIYGPFNHRQLGRTDEWLLAKLEESASSGEAADKDYLNIWPTGTEGSPLSPEDKRRVKEGEREPLYTELTKEGYILRWFVEQQDIVHRMANGHYVLGVDPSELLGENNDATGFVVIDVETHDVVCSGRYNESNVPMLSAFIANFLIQFKNVTFIPERKSTGIAILDQVFILLVHAGEDPFRRIYNRIVDNPEEFKTEWREVQAPLYSRTSNLYDRNKRHFGFNTSGAGAHSRDALYKDALKSVLQYGARRLHDKVLTDELLSLTIKNGRIDHSSGKHDDMVVSLLLAHWFCIRARNLSHYGINPLSVFTRASYKEDEMTPVERNRMMQQSREKERFLSILDQLKEAREPMEITRLEMALRQLSRRVNFDDITAAGIDALISNTREERYRTAKVDRTQPQQAIAQDFASAWNMRRVA